MGQVLIASLALFLVVAAAYIALVVLQKVRRGPWPDDSASYRNHLGMARWIEHQLRDDMVRVTIPPHEQATARRLLEDFYGERQIGPGE